MSAPRRPTSGYVSPTWMILGSGLLLVVSGLLFYAFTMLGASEDLSTGYGRSRGYGYADSVNGTAVLEEMFKKAGYRVANSSRLSPRVLDSEVMVWAPDSYDVPDEEVRNYFLEWLEFYNGRVLVYIGRDYDAAVSYWQDIHDETEDQRLGRVEREAAFSETEALQQRMKVEDGTDADWFVIDALSPPKTVTKLSGPWAKGVDVSKTNITLDVRLHIPKNSKSREWHAETLLAGNGEPLVTRLTHDDVPGEILIVQNGSFLLNYPLVNHENRKLAGALIEECGEPGKVTFLASDAYGLPVIEQETREAVYAFSVLRVWPINLIMLHAAMLGILYCFARAPIFGRPRKLPVESTSDFGMHVSALGELLAKSKNPDYAQQRLYHYWKQSHRASGATHRIDTGAKPPKHPLPKE